MTGFVAPQFLHTELAPEENDPETAWFHVLPCGLEASVSYGRGTAGGPEAVIRASRQLERCIGDGVDDDPCRHGIFTHPPLDCRRPVETVLADLRAAVRAVAQRGRIPVVLGGEHTVSYGAVMGVADAAADPIGIVQVDAHADFRRDYQGCRYSHAGVMGLLAREGGMAIASLGVRAMSREESEARRAYGVIAYDAPDLVRRGVHRIDLPDLFPKNVYVTFDLDGLDPSVLPMTGTPVPGGLGFYQALDLVGSALVGRRCVGMDVVELAPVPGHHASDFTAASICYRIMAMATPDRR